MFLSISAEGRIVMLVKRKSSHSQRLALEPILSQCVDHPQNFANRYKRKQENSLCLVPDIILIWINIAQSYSFANLASRTKRSIMSGTDIYPASRPPCRR